MIDFPQLAKDATKEARALLKRRFESFKGENFKVNESASNEEIKAMKNNILSHWPDMKMENVSKQEVMANESFKTFYDKHVRQTAYCLTIKKCPDLNCEFHSWPRLDQEVFQKLNWIPSPTPNTADNKTYMNLEQTYGNEPTDEHCPSVLNRGNINSSVIS